MNHQSKFNPQHEEEHAAIHTRAAQAQPGRQFASVEEMLRLAAEEPVVPLAVSERLQTSSAREPEPAHSWWQRFFGG